MSRAYKYLLLFGFGLSTIASQAAPAHAEKPKAEFGFGASARQLRLTRGLLELASKEAPPGTRTEGYSIEFARRGAELEFVFGFGYDNWEASNGYYLESGGNPSVPGQVDFVEFDGLHLFTADASFVGYLPLHKILSLRYGAGLGIAMVRGQALRTDAQCSSERIRRDCVPDPDGAQQREPMDIPKALPVVQALIGLQFRPVEAVAINLDLGLHNVPYVGAGLMFYLW